MTTKYLLAMVQVQSYWAASSLKWWSYGILRGFGQLAQNALDPSSWSLVAWKMTDHVHGARKFVVRLRTDEFPPQLNSAERLGFKRVRQFSVRCDVLRLSRAVSLIRKRCFALVRPTRLIISTLLTRGPHPSSVDSYRDSAVYPCFIRFPSPLSQLQRAGQDN